MFKFFNICWTRWITCLLLTTPATKLSPGRFVMRRRSRSPWRKDELRRFPRYSFCKQILPETVHATSWRELFWFRGCDPPAGFFRRFRYLGNKIGFFIDIWSRRGYQGWDCQAGVIRRTFASSSWTFWSTLPIRENGGKAYPFKFFQLCWKESVPWLLWSSLQE